VATCVVGCLAAVGRLSIVSIGVGPKEDILCVGGNGPCGFFQETRRWEFMQQTYEERKGTKGAFWGLHDEG